MWILKHQLQKQCGGFKFFNVYGPNEYHKGDMRSMVHKGYQQIKANGSIRLFKSYRSEYPDGGQQRDFVYVKDAVNIVWYFLTHPDNNGIYNVGTGHAHSWNDLAHALFKALKCPPSVEYIDMPDALRGKYQYYTQADCSKLNTAGASATWDFVKAIHDYVTILETTQYL
jgi:ADP-L-glycero-D-manno-heptose 6-epimerase